LNSSLRGAIMACKHVLPLMRAQCAGAIITISSVAAWEQYPNVAYKATKAGMIAFTQQVAIQNAESGVRANVILPEFLTPPRLRRARVRCSAKTAPVAPPPIMAITMRPALSTRRSELRYIQHRNSQLELSFNHLIKLQAAQSFSDHLWSSFNRMALVFTLVIIDIYD
jgi:NAD(P)-dependent dehydrogenase (short-subunit alcohol dehydrogenase family)